MVVQTEYFRKIYDATYDKVLKELGDSEKASPASINFYAGIDVNSKRFYLFYGIINVIFVQAPCKNNRHLGF